LEIAKASAGLTTAVIKGFLKLNSHSLNTKEFHHDLHFLGKFGANMAILQLRQPEKNGTLFPVLAYPICVNP
jgi:hypothetical protein